MKEKLENLIYEFAVISMVILLIWGSQIKEISFALNSILILISGTGLGLALVLNLREHEPSFFCKGITACEKKYGNK